MFIISFPGIRNGQVQGVFWMQEEVSGSVPHHQRGLNQARQHSSFVTAFSGTHYIYILMLLACLQIMFVAGRRFSIKWKMFL